MGGLPQEVRAPLRAVERQAAQFHRVVVQVMKPLVVVSEGAPERLRVAPRGMEILVVARHVDDRGDTELMRG